MALYLFAEIIKQLVVEIKVLHKLEHSKRLFYTEGRVKLYIVIYLGLSYISVNLPLKKLIRNSFKTLLGKTHNTQRGATLDNVIFCGCISHSAWETFMVSFEGFQQHS